MPRLSRRALSPQRKWAAVFFVAGLVIAAGLMPTLGTDTPLQRLLAWDQTHSSYADVIFGSFAILASQAHFYVYPIVPAVLALLAWIRPPRQTRTKKVIGASLIGLIWFVELFLWISGAVIFALLHWSLSFFEGVALSLALPAAASGAIGLYCWFPSNNELSPLRWYPPGNKISPLRIDVVGLIVATLVGFWSLTAMVPPIISAAYIADGNPYCIKAPRKLGEPLEINNIWRLRGFPFTSKHWMSLNASHIGVLVVDTQAELQFYTWTPLRLKFVRLPKDIESRQLELARVPCQPVEHFLGRWSMFF